MSGYHIPVMLQEAIDGLDIKEDGIYVDATFGGGGHSMEILKRMSGGRIIAFDQDEDAEANLPGDERLTFINHNFSELKRFLKLNKVLPVDGILADLGISSHQIDTAERGFSTRFDANLDMRMSQTGKSAREVINTYSLDDLTYIFKEYGELTNARSLAESIVGIRAQQPFATTTQLQELLRHHIYGKPQQFFARLFQALRIEVNAEIEALKSLLIQSAEVLKAGGRLVVISYHSLEDRLVKQFMKNGNFSDQLNKDFYGNPLRPFKPVNSKALKPSTMEIRQNARSRSARLRIAEKIS